MGAKGDAGPVLPVKQPETDSESGEMIQKKKGTKPEAVAAVGGANTKKLAIITILGIAAALAVVLGVIYGGGSGSSSSRSSNDNGGNDSGSSGSGSGDGVAQNTFQPNLGPFDDITVPLYTPGFIEVYPDRPSAGEGFETLAKFLLNNLVQRNIGTPGFENAARGGSIMVEDDANFDSEAPVAGAPEQEREKQDPTDGANGYETNNQEDGVDQADISKSDGTHIFSGFRDRLLIIDAATGDSVVDLMMPQVEEYKPVHALGDYPSKEQSLEQSTSRSSVFYRDPKPYIQSLILGTNRLVVVVTGYGDDYSNGEISPQGEQRRTILSSYLSTHCRIYDTSDLANGNIRLLAVQDLNGYFMSGYMIGNIAHIATSSNMNTYEWIVRPNERWQKQFSGLSDEEYAEAVKVNAGDQTIQEFIDRLGWELSASTGTFPNVTALSLMSEVTSGVDGFENMIFENGYANSMVQIASFDMMNLAIMNSNGAQGDPEKFSLGISVQFLPSYWAQAYSNVDRLLIAGQGYTFDVDSQASIQTTYLFGYSLNGVSTKPVLAGSVPGNMLNEYSIDFSEGFVRVATTVRRWWPVRGGVAVEPAGGRRSLESETTRCPPVEEECNDETNVEICYRLEKNGCQEIVISSDDACPIKYACGDMDPPSRCPPVEENCNDATNAQLCYNLEQAGCDSISIRESCPLQFGCEDKIAPTPAPTERTESLTKNRIFVLKAPDGENTLQVTGSVLLGKKDETFTAVRFFDKIAYAVTFLQRDPFYVISFENPRIPVVLGELDISGFSSYLHSLNAENTLILGVGQETDDMGNRLGLQISLFDTSMPSEPRLLDRYVVNEKGEQWSNSAAEWDEKAFRYLRIDDNEGRLILPVSYSLVDGSYFNGFSVFTITKTTVAPAYDIAHRKGNYNNKEDANQCYYCGGHLMDRSFVIDGDVITLQGHSILSSDLGDGMLRWMRNFRAEDGNCCGW